MKFNPLMVIVDALENDFNNYVQKARKTKDPKKKAYLLDAMSKISITADVISVNYDELFKAFEGAAKK